MNLNLTNNNICEEYKSNEESILFGYCNSNHLLKVEKNKVTKTLYGIPVSEIDEIPHYLTFKIPEKILHNPINPIYITDDYTYVVFFNNELYFIICEDNDVSYYFIQDLEDSFNSNNNSDEENLSDDTESYYYPNNSDDENTFDFNSYYSDDENNFNSYAYEA